MCYLSSAAARGKVATPISFPAANSSALGAFDCISAHNNRLRMMTYSWTKKGAPRVHFNYCGVCSDTQLDDVGLNDVVCLLSIAPDEIVARCERTNNFYLLCLLRRENAGFTSLGVTFYPVVNVCRRPGGAFSPLPFVLFVCIITVIPLIIVNVFSGFTAGGFLR